MGSAGRRVPARTATVGAIAAALTLLCTLSTASCGAEAQPAPRRTINVHWVGQFFAHHSYAVVNRNLAAGLMRRPGFSVTAMPTHKHEFEPSPTTAAAGMRELFDSLAHMVDNPVQSVPDITITHEWPPRLSWPGPGTGLWVVIQPWEMCSLPSPWIAPMNDPKITEIWVPSLYVKACYDHSGVIASKVRVIPNGVNPDIFNPALRHAQKPYPLRTKKSFKFLFVGGTIFRKGIDILLEAYQAAFTDQDDVALIIKDTGRARYYKTQGADASIKAIQDTPGAPTIEYYAEEIPDEDVPSLYGACDCLVLPYRGEGFGLPILEAMAMGLPVIVTGHGAAMDFVNESYGYLIKAKGVDLGTSEIGNVKEFKTVENMLISQPDKDHLVQLLTHVFHNRGEAAVKGQRGAHHARSNYGWNSVVKLVSERIEELLDEHQIDWNQSEL